MYYVHTMRSSTSNIRIAVSVGFPTSWARRAEDAVRKHSRPPCTVFVWTWRKRVSARGIPARTPLFGQQRFDLFGRVVFMDRTSYWFFRYSDLNSGPIRARGVVASLADYTHVVVRFCLTTDRDRPFPARGNSVRRVRISRTTRRMKRRNRRQCP